MLNQRDRESSYSHHNHTNSDWVNLDLGAQVSNVGGTFASHGMQWHKARVKLTDFNLATLDWDSSTPSGVSITALNTCS